MLSVDSRNILHVIYWSYFYSHFAAAKTIRDAAKLVNTRPNLLISSLVFLSFYLAPLIAETRQVSKQHRADDWQVREWCPTKKIQVHGRLGVFWVISLPKQYSGQGVILFIRCQRVAFLYKLNARLAGQKKANKNCMRFRVGWGRMAGAPLLTWPLLHERGRWASARLMCILEKLLWHKHKRLCEGKFMRLRRPEELTTCFFCRKDMWKIKILSLCPFKIWLIFTLYPALCQALGNTY